MQKSRIAVTRKLQLGYVIVSKGWEIEGREQKAENRKRILVVLC
jgi:hypothetical protein